MQSYLSKGWCWRPGVVLVLVLALRIEEIVLVDVVNTATDEPVVASSYQESQCMIIG